MNVVYVTLHYDVVHLIHIHV